jgi:hypothetical protein
VKILILTNHYPKHERVQDLEFFGHIVEFSIFKKVDIIAAHWIFPSGLIACILSFLTRKPLYLVFYGDPYMIEKYWWVRIPAWFICKRAKKIQVISTPCYNIMYKFCGKEKLVLLPCH